MPVEDKLLQWINTLTRSEKRLISLIGKARAGSRSQVLELFDWLNKANPGDIVPPEATFAGNLPTLAVRLRELTLDCLRLLNKEENINATLRTGLDEIAILQSKKQWSTAARLLRKIKKLAYDNSRYSNVLQCIEAELQQAQQLPPNEIAATLAQIRGEEEKVIGLHKTLRDLRFRHDAILALAKQFPFSRDAEITAQVNFLSNGDAVTKHLSDNSPYIENALAVNVLGMRDLFMRQPEPAIKRYSKLLNLWKTKHEWQEDQSDLLITICKYYQNVCFFSTVSPGKVHSELLALKGFDGLSPEKLRSFRETMFHHRFIHQLNTAKIDRVIEMIPEIDKWLNEEQKNLTESQVLPFLCNMLVAEFLSGDFAKTNSRLNQILSLPNKNVRVDIREFALVLQLVVQYELGNVSLNEYLTRSGKRHFGKNETLHHFELAVIRCIEQLIKTNDKKLVKKNLDHFLNELDVLRNKHTQTVPLLGINEITMWAISRKTGQPLPDVFVNEVKKAHAAANSDELK